MTILPYYSVGNRLPGDQFEPLGMCLCDDIESKVLLRIERATQLEPMELSILLSFSEVNRKVSYQNNTRD